MRLGLRFILERMYLPLNYREIFFNFFENALKEYDGGFYDKLRHEWTDKEKPCTFSILLNDTEKIGDRMELWSDNLIIKFSTASREIGVEFYNAMMMQKYKSKSLDGVNKFKLVEIDIVKEKSLESNEVIFRTISPIRIEEKSFLKQKVKFVSLEDMKYIDILKKDILNKVRLNYNFPNEYLERDVKNIRIDVLRNSMVKMDIDESIVNEAILKINARKYILDYIYKSGLGNSTSMGYGMLEIV